MPSSDVTERLVLLNLLRGASVPSYTPFMGLSTTPIADPGTGVTEPSAGFNYTRIPILTDADGLGNPAYDAATIIASVGDAVPNDNKIEWQIATGGNWGTIVAWFIADTISAGLPDTIRSYGLFAVPKTINDGQRFSIPAGQFLPTAS